MRKLLIAALLLGAVACSNPEDGAEGSTTDGSSQNGENSTLNSPPGGASDDTSGGATMDTSHADSSHR